MTKDELLALLRLCNADPSAIDAVELAYELGFKAGQAEKSETYPDNFIDALKFDMALREFSCPRCGHVCSQSIDSGS